MDDRDLEALRATIGATIDGLLPDGIGCVIVLARDDAQGGSEWCGRQFNMSENDARDLLHAASQDWATVEAVAGSN